MVFVRVENFFSKFKKLETREERDKKICEILKRKILNTEFKITIRGGTIHTYNISPTARSEIFLRKRELLENMKNELGDLAPSDISFLKP